MSFALSSSVSIPIQHRGSVESFTLAKKLFRSTRVSHLDEPRTSES
jgi:hypothetical protein